MIHKESLCINCGCCVSECNAMESDPEFIGPAGAREGHAVRRRRARPGRTLERLEELNARARHLGVHALLLLQRALPQGRRPARRDREARRRVDQEGIDRDMGAKHAKWFVKSAKTTGWLRETELVPKTQGDRLRDQADASSRSTSRARARCRRRSRRTSPRTSRRRAALLRPRQGAGPRRRRRASCRASRRSRGSSSSDGRRAAPRGTRAPARRRRAGNGHREEGRVLQGMSRLALGEGARHLDAGARAEGRASSSIELESVTCCGAGDIHEAEPDYYLHLNARILAYAEATASTRS